MSKKKKKQLRKERQEQDGRESNEKSREVSPENMSSDEQQKEKKEQDTTTTIQMSNKKKKLLMRRERKLRQFKHEMSLINVDQKTLERRKQQIEEQREAQRKQKQKREEWKNGKLSAELVDKIKEKIKMIEFFDMLSCHTWYMKYKSERIEKGLLLERIPVSSNWATIFSPFEVLYLSLHNYFVFFSITKYFFEFHSYFAQSKSLTIL